MDFITIAYLPDLEMWDFIDEIPETYRADHNPFYEGAELSGLQWEHLDKLQKYQFRIFFDEGQVKGLRFLGTEARWGEFVPATQDQLVLKRPL